MADTNDALVAARFAKACVDARAYLWRQMEERGLHARDGWKIVETVRQITGGSELVMRPLHLHLAAPDDLECVVALDMASTTIDSSCPP
jgi:hypothetical protein